MKLGLEWRQRTTILYLHGADLVHQSLRAFWAPDVVLQHAWAGRKDSQGQLVVSASQHPVPMPTCYKSGLRNPEARGGRPLLKCSLMDINDQMLCV